MRTFGRYFGTLVVTVVFLTGCKVADSKVKSTVIERPSSVKSFILMDDSGYFGQFAAALAKEGFTLRPVATQAIRNEQASPTVRRTFGEAGDRYALRVDLRPTNMTCVFSSNRLYNGTLTVLDLQENTTLMVFEAEGPDGECPPLTPIWDLFARSLRENLPK